MAKSNGIVMVTTPPHTSHQLQPLDRTVYGPFKAAYNRAADEWLRSHPVQTITIYDIPSIVNEAHMSAMTPRNIVSGFASTGIYPFNRNLFTDAKFAPSAVTDRDFVNQAKQQPSCSYSAESSLAAILEQEETSQEQEIAAENNSSTSAVAQGRSDEYVSPSAIHAFSRVRQVSKAPTRRRKKGSSKILTNTPVRNQIMQKERRILGRNSHRQKKNTFCARTSRQNQLRIRM